MARPQQQSQMSQRKVRIPIVGSAQNRQTNPNKDQRFVNFFPESIKTPINNAQKIYLIKRAGLRFSSTVASNKEGRGIWYFNGNTYSIFANKMYKDGVEIKTLSTSTGPCGAIEATGVTKYLFICDGIGAWVINNTGTITDVTDVNFPSPHIPTPVFIDGYVLLIKKDSADIYNSTLDDPTTWPPSDFITAELYPDDLKALARQNNQVVAMGITSTEFFFDAANASGSPLSRNDATALQFGTCAPYAVFQNEKFCILVGQSASGGRAVWEVDGFTPKKISTEYIEKIIDAEGSNIEKATSFGVRVQGHLFYVLNLYSQGRTLVYDLEERMWHEWSSNDGSDNHTRFGGSFVADDQSGTVIVQHYSDGNIYRLDPTQYTDNSSNIICDAVTTKLDFDTMDRKFISNMNIVGDISEATTTPITFRWSDDDYKSWSNWKTLDMSAARMFFTRLGAFRRRAFQFRYLDNYPCRLEAVEFELYAGNT